MDEMMAVVKLFAGNFTPTGYLECNGQLLQISQNQALFALLGTMYGGDGISTFALPNLKSNVPVGVGQGPDAGMKYMICNQGVFPSRP